MLACNYLATCQCHLTLAQTAMQIKYYSSRESRGIARLLSDEHVFGLKGQGTQKLKVPTKYSEMWQSWLENNGMDLVMQIFAVGIYDIRATFILSFVDDVKF